MTDDRFRFLDDSWYPHAFAQLSTRADWSDARRVVPMNDDVGDATEDDTGPIAFEAFYPTDDTHPLLAQFIGLRAGKGDGQSASDARRWLESLATETVLQTPNRFVDALRHRYGAECFASTIAHLEIGEVNAWRHAVRMPASTVEGASPSRLILNAHPELRRATRHPLALEVAFSTPCAHWIAWPVSRVVPDGYQLDSAQLERALACARRLRDSTSRVRG